MSFQFTCQVCGRELKADERAIGRKVRCPDCATLLIIPDPNGGEDDDGAESSSGEDDFAGDSDESPTPDDELPRNVAQAPAPPEQPAPPTKTSQQSTLPPTKNAPRPRAPESPPEVDLSVTAEMEPLTELPPTPPQRSGRQDSRRTERTRRRVPEQDEMHLTVAPAPPSEPPAPQRPLRTANSFHEAPLLPPPQPLPEDLIDMTAMVDIVFFLLIFFLVTSLQALEAVMDMATPQSGEAGVTAGKTVAELENDKNFITVHIEDDDSIWVENTQVFNDQELIVKLRHARQESDSPRSLLVIGDADASHGTAVRVFDAGAAASVSGISLVVQEKAEGSR